MVIAGILGLMHDRIPKPFRERKCMGAAWKKTFPDVDASEIRKLLKILTHVFGFNRKDGLKFAPTDTFMEIYSGIYKHPWIVADELEHVEFILTLEEDFGKEYPNELAEKDATLGEIFESMHQNANKTRHRTSRCG